MSSFNLEAFAYKKKPRILEVIQSDSESSSVQCLDNDDIEFEDGFVCRRKKRKEITIDSDSDNSIVEEITQQKSKRKRVCILDSDEDDHEDKQGGEVVEIPSDPSVQDVDACGASMANGEEEDTEASFEQSFNKSQTSIDENIRILSFLNTCTIDQLCSIPGCSNGRAEKIKKLIPFDTIDEMVENINNIKRFSADNFFDGCIDYLNEVEKFKNLMAQCEELSQTIDQELLLEHKDADKLPIQQPVCVDSSLQLKHYQVVGLNWLAMLHERKLNGILADQMGLGKTIQALTFLGYLLENGHSGPHVIVCPCSTFDNWIREFEKWLPDVSYTQYSGSQTERFHLRRDLIEEQETGVIITTLNIILSTKQDRTFFRKLNIQYLILDEAHMIKNMKSGRYKHLLSLQQVYAQYYLRRQRRFYHVYIGYMLSILQEGMQVAYICTKASRKLLLTGTPLQNDLVELLSLLTFLMPDMFEGNQERIKFLFCKSNVSNENTNAYEKQLLPKVKKMLKPFILRRLKKDVLHDIPGKLEHISLVELTSRQLILYKSFLEEYSHNTDGNYMGGLSLVMKLRKVTNHPLLVRSKYDDVKIMEMAKEYVNSPYHVECDVNYVYEDMSVMSDFEIHMLCKKEMTLKPYQLTNEDICDCGKLNWFDQMLPKLYNKGDRVLIFSQFVIVLDLLMEYLKIRNYTFLRIDGSTKGSDRQSLIDEYNDSKDVFIFLLSTKAGGLGINLTSANAVIFHDIDFNPYNDKQAEDRCHRVGQIREVNVYKCIGKNTVEESMLKCGERKLLLEKEIVGDQEEPSSEQAEQAVDTSKDVVKLLLDTL